MLHEIEYLEIVENPITMVDAVMQAIGNSAMPERQEEVEVEVEVDTQDQPSVSLHSADNV
jgi:hypothetical protein